MAAASNVAAIFLDQAAPAVGAPAASTTVSPLIVQGQKPISKRHEVNLEEMTCHDELPSGTRFKIKVCAANRQFLERTRDQQQLVREWQNTPITTSVR